ncbi:NAD-dependent epimerase/dehydratase family protein [Tissierella sp. Yu-01]|uniref:NAD-dependent epimerase/dehydratase family protein n=1 Tax=Tissierella sp. Yu-01 TaxID=3035694 RepID=UPI00240E751B|nr:NAD-dependent epimerase/dehydratase family protein [Tissierella sp. Yu-01]WFA10154.1 NAD-dependent epimerase/dehydratase family protein [Tissierella sp. Yu-01]
MKILITGGFGYIGRNLIKTFLRENHEITVIDDLSSGIEIKSKDITFYKLDVQDKNCEMIFTGNEFDIVIHLAFRGYSNDEYLANDNDIYENHIGMNNILYWSKKYNVGKVILLSSLVVPNNIVGMSYLSRENIAKEYIDSKLNVVVLRVGAVYGENHYGTDLSYIKSNMENPNDFIHVEDLCNAVLEVIESYTEPILEISNSFSENFTLNWVPKKIFDEEAKAMFNVCKNKEKLQHLEVGVNDKTKKKKIFVKSEIEVAVIFSITFFLNSLIRYRLGLDVDLFIFFIAGISLYYGLAHGISAVLLSVIVYIYIYFNYYDKTILMLIYDISSILYMTFYFILGTSIGYYIDEEKRKKKYLIDEIEMIKKENSFLIDLYQKSQEVKNNLQYTLESYENNMSRTDSLIEMIISAPITDLYHVVTEIYVSYFHAKDVACYNLGSNKSTLNLVAISGNNLFKESYNINDNFILRSVILNKEIYINKDFIAKQPLFIIPLFKDNAIIGIIFLDNIQFNYLNQSYLNNLNITTKLISNLLYLLIVRRRA